MNRPGDKVTKWGYSFVWTERHLSRGEIEPLRQQYDTLGSEALNRLQAIRASLHGETHHQDLYTLLRENHHHDDTLSQLWTGLHTVPDWVNWEQLARGQRVFYRYAIANIVGFALQGFVAENSAAPGVVEVLIRTGGFSTRTLLNRLLETFQWLIQVTHDLASIQPGGEAHIATIRVRLLHASVRQRILQLCQRTPDYFDIQTYGIPVNTLDSIHSISTFCCNPMWLQLPRFGIRPSNQDVEDYIALFRYLGHLLGAPTEYFDSVESAKLTMESMLAHELRTTETSRVVAYNFVECVGHFRRPYYVSKRFIEAGSRWINGHELCDELDLGRPGGLHYVAFGGHCVLVAVLAWVQWAVPFLDGVVIELFRKVMYTGVVMRKRTRFDFKYIPQLGKNTGKEKRHGYSSKELGFADMSISPYALDMGLFEAFFVAVLVVVAGAVIGGGLWGYTRLGI
ncbi:hypothetical protein FE257_001677 [Aspergillus nanangensis]|uniref:ER-bound oxygenase mpaB/mpaB'/Rubber oxygenase catalytic domain-containing protein n=1 Tax=Aspergillus nanangensis TaxID=2582783 RepID=A0AAD4CDI6_ASPNN|nr:hypothetical protein FE257_001677 [Aspergillus nanangensis]